MGGGLFFRQGQGVSTARVRTQGFFSGSGILDAQAVNRVCGFFSILEIFRMALTGSGAYLSGQ
jgi:hypothetical protein